MKHEMGGLTKLYDAIISRGGRKQLPYIGTGWHTRDIVSRIAERSTKTPINVTHASYNKEI